MDVQPKRISVKMKQPNPLFESWLKQWKNKAKEKGSKLEHSYSLALESLKKYPLPLKSGKDCKILYGFGEKLCSMLDKKLQDYYQASCEKTENQQNNNDNDIGASETNVSTKISPQKEGNLSANDGIKFTDHGHCEALNLEHTDIINKYEASAVAILVALNKCASESDAVEQFTKAEIIEKLLPGSKSIAWAQHMNTLISDKLITRVGKPYKFSLTQEGMSLAKQLNEESSNFSQPSKESKVPNVSPIATQTSVDRGLSISLINDVHREFSQPQASTQAEPCSSQKTDMSSQSAGSVDTFFLSPDTFDIILYVDTSETGAMVDVYKDPFLIELQNLGTLFEIKHLNVGDYTWICRDRSNAKELVLPYIVERKRLDDFAKSIKDGRYHEQKYRLKKSGIQNIYYLIENFGKKEKTGLPIMTLQQAAINTVIQDGFYVKSTNSLSHTARYLADFTKFLIKTYKSKTLFSCARDYLKSTTIEDDLIPAMVFRDFDDNSSKNRPISVSDLFAKMLLQINGMSIDKALAIVEAYPTPLLLRKAYESCDSNHGAKLLSDIQFGKFRKKIGPTLSRTLYQLFTFESFNSV